ncbi:ER membrane protein complex subunit 10 [Cinnamomum micranthum f. kanehirae]|uniref:ER membrane protein complex subunit 10 n=1 Tax=Cinnamomum micranthum f. kanehirae TaxID=337451 RepID=A0A443NZC2_9MAGN|nr:ER membrane protein complex subunit 10 [Cinnamomum micranthum f. kanehirae]
MKRIQQLRFFFYFLSLFFILFFSCSCISSAFQSDELLHDDDEFEGVRSPDFDHLNPKSSPITRKRSSSDPDSSSISSDSKVQFSLDHAFGDGSDFSPAGTFTARLKTLNHGGQTLTKLRFSRNTFTETEKEKFKKLLEDDDFYRIRIPSSVLNPPGKDYVISSVKARCLPRESLDELFVIHMEGVKPFWLLIMVQLGHAKYPKTTEICKMQPTNLFLLNIYPPAKWSFKSNTVTKNSELVPRTPAFSEETLLGENGEGEGILPPEKSFWSKYWMYMIPLGLIVMNAFTQAMNLPEEQAAGQAASQGQQPVAPRPANPALRRR